MPITDLKLTDMARALADKEFSAVEAAQAHLERIAAVDPQVGAFLTVTAEQALAAAAASDARRAAGQTLSPLDGVPMALKDIICTNGVRTTCASRILEHFVPPYDATCWQRLEQSGAVLLGKLNLDEFAMGSSTETSAFQLTRNPFDPERAPGGSSGGSAAAVAADLAVYTLGTDTGGSVRQPAHFCGVVGVKPTYGRISRYGVIPYASSLDQVGVLAKDCADAGAVLESVSGRDPMDSTSAPEPVGAYQAACAADIRNMKIGIPREFLSDAIDLSIRDELSRAADKLSALGAEISEVSLPHTASALPAYYIQATAEASSNLARYDGVRFGLRVDAPDLHEMMVRTRSAGFGPEVKNRIMLGTYVLSSGYYDAYYDKAQRVRTLIKRDYDEVFDQGFSCLLTPVAPTSAFKFGFQGDDPLVMYMQDVCTVPVNMAGLPGLVVPVALNDEGLPIGLQLIGRPFGEESLFAVGAKLEGPRLLPPLDR